MPFISHVQSTLTIPYWQIRLLQKPICNCKVNTHGVLGVISTIVANTFIHHPMHKVLGEVKKAILVQPSCCKQGPLCCLFTVTLHFLGGEGVIFLFLKWSPIRVLKCCAVQRSCEQEDCDMPYRGNNVLEKLCSGMSYSTVT